jgi:hypothetical protein
MAPTDPLSPPATPRPSHLIRKHTQELSDADAHHLPTPGPDTGSFSTLEVRTREQLAEITSRNIKFPWGNYATAPNVAGGFKMLDLAVRRPIGGSEANEEVPAVRANLVGSEMSEDGFRIGLETWEGGVMYAAAATWIEHKAGARECHFGQFDSMDVDGDEPPRFSRKRRRGAEDAKGSVEEDGMQVEGHGPPEVRDGDSQDSEPEDEEDQDDSDEGDHVPQRYTLTSAFPVRFHSPPSVICWLNRIDMPTGPERNFRVRASASKITRTSVSICLETWGPGDSVLSGAAMCWIAFPRSKKKVDSGSFGTVGSSSSSADDAAGGSIRKIEMYEAEHRKPQTSGRVRFRDGWFEKAPTVLVALNMLDMSGDADLRIKVEVEDVDREGFTWRLESWVSFTSFTEYALSRAGNLRACKETGGEQGGRWISTRC